MRKKKSRRSSKGWSWQKLKKDDRVVKVAGMISLMMSLYLAVAFISYLYTWKIDQDKVLRFSWSILLEGDLSVNNWLGRLGAVVSNLFFYWGFGLPSLFTIAILFRVGLQWIRQRPLTEIGEWVRTIAIMTFFTSIFLEFIFAQSEFPWGGAFGESSCIWLSNFIGTIGLGILLTFSIIVFLIWTFNPDFERVEYALEGMKPNVSFATISLSKFKSALPAIPSFKRTASEETATPETISDPEWKDDLSILERASGTTPTDPVAATVKNEASIAMDTEVPPQIIEKIHDDSTELEISLGSESEDLEQSEGSVSMDPVLHIKEENRNHTEPYDPKKDLRDFKMPPLDLLNDYENKVEIDREELESKKNQIINTLKHYNIEITKIRATVGPTVTLYEIVPAPGIRISKIKNLEDDIALSLSALGIRIIAPIPGKGTIGIEVPNKNRQVVALKDIIRSDKFQKAKMDLPIALGKTISNDVFVADLAKMPHLLVAGATGQGKSVGVNAILMSLLYKKHPSQVKFILVDPKKVELPIYNEIKNHYLAALPEQEEAIITDTTKVIHTLNSLCIEMDERYDLLKMARARNIKEYNEKFYFPKNSIRTKDTDFYHFSSLLSMNSQISS